MKENILNGLRVMFENPECELKFRNNFELLVAVILSAQCTDKRVNSVTPILFTEYGTPEKMADAKQKDIEKIIRPCGFFRNKAKNIISASKDIISRFGGAVPGTLKELTSLAGVGKKTANVVISVGFGGDAIAVDTHVFRVSNRLGIVCAKNPQECEAQLEKFFDKNTWSEVHYLLVLFGRYHCKARAPECEECCFKANCNHFTIKTK